MSGARRSRLRRIRQKGGKWVEAFAAEGDFDPEAIVSNMVQRRMAAEERAPPALSRRSTAPPGSRLAEARVKILPSQAPYRSTRWRRSSA